MAKRKPDKRDIAWRSLVTEPPYRIDHTLLSLSFGCAIAFWLIPRMSRQPTSTGQNQQYEVVSNGVSDGNTMRVTDGTAEVTVKLCGIVAPTRDQPMASESRAHLGRLSAQGKGRIVLVTTSKERDGHTIAEAFVQIEEGEELYLNGQMVADGMAYASKSTESCPNGGRITALESKAKSLSIGLWGPSPSDEAAIPASDDSYYDEN